jgi:hypothetical protein
LVILACGSLWVGIQQSSDGRQRSLEDESSVKREETPPQLAIGLSTSNPSSSIMGLRIKDGLSSPPVFALDSQV